MSHEYELANFSFSRLKKPFILLLLDTINEYKSRSVSGGLPDLCILSVL